MQDADVSIRYEDGVQTVSYTHLSRVASGNGKVLIVLTNAVALVSYVKTGNVAYEIAVPAALSAILGNLVGVNLAIKKGDKIIKPVMLIIVILTVVKFAWENQLWG